MYNKITQKHIYFGGVTCLRTKNRGVWNLFFVSAVFVGLDCAGAAFVKTNGKSHINYFLEG